MVLLLTKRQMDAHVGQGAFVVCLVVSSSQQEFMEDVLVRPNEAVKKAVSRARYCGNSRFADWISRIECSCTKYAAISVLFVFAGKLWTVLLRYWHACYPKAIFANFSMLCTMQYRFHCVLTLVRPR